MSFPHSRPRRNRKAQWSLDLVAETSLNPENLVLPIFLIDGYNQEEPITSMPGISRYTRNLALDRVKKAEKAGIKLIMLFPCVSSTYKTEDAACAFDRDFFLYKAIAEIKSACPKIGIAVDVALDPYTSHGHDGLLDLEGYVENDRTVEALCKQALVIAKAGADAVAPSDMMDGRVLKIREILETNSYYNVQIISYAAKYASNLFSPFREAVYSQGTLRSKSKSNYQMDWRNSKEAVLEAKLDIEEGADMLIVKPAMLYCDIIYRISTSSPIPVLGYQVSGEYAMIKNLDIGVNLMLESIVSIRRAGATAVITYAALEVAEILT